MDNPDDCIFNAPPAAGLFRENIVHPAYSLYFAGQGYLQKC
jgi:hypothetical protein